MYCPNCASPAHRDVKFCTSCGTNLNAISDLLSGKIIEPSQSREVVELLEKCHKGYLSTVIGLGLVIASLLITVAAAMFGVIPAAISGLIFLGWAIPAIAQGAGKWLSARREMISILRDRQPEKSLPSDSAGFAGSVTEGTTAGLEQ